MPQRDWLHLSCDKAGHDWVSVGGRNAACEYEDCACSVPVHQCRRCKDYDYGDNDEAAKVRAECEAFSRPVVAQTSKAHVQQLRSDH